MAIIGFIFLTILLILVTLSWFFTAAFTFTKFTIGGALNTARDKILMSFSGLSLSLFWILLIDNCPFMIITK